MKQMKSTVQKGFTLVELLIVVIIIAILASILVPQFSSSTDDAKLAALDSTLANVRSAIDLYYQQHGHYPSAVATGGGTCDAGAAVAAAADDPLAFMAALSNYTNSAGQACTGTAPGSDFKYGPYLKKSTLPDNPMTGDSTLAAIDTAQVLGMTADGVGLGWKFNNKTGQFISNDTPTQDR